MSLSRANIAPDRQVDIDNAPGLTYTYTVGEVGSQATREKDRVAAEAAYGLRVYVT